MSVMDPRNNTSGLPLVWRLLLPLIIVAAFTWVGMTAFLVNVISEEMDLATGQRMNSLAESLIEGGMALDESLLSRVRAVTGSDLVVLSAGGSILASTLPEHQAAIVAGRIAEQPVSGEIVLEEERYLVLAKRPVAGGVGTYVLVVVTSTRMVDGLKTGLAWMVAGSAGIGLFLVIVLGHLIIRSATKPLVRLAEAARDIGRGSMDRPVPEAGSRETRILAREFNTMIGELETSRKELVRTERLATAGKMAAGVAHEIRNPLSSLRLRAQLLAGRTNGKEQTDRCLGEILEEVDRLDQVLANFLNIASPSKLETEPENLNAVVESTLKLTSRKLEHLEVAVEKELSPDLPDVPMDSRRIRQALLNLILNAAESMPGGGTLRVATRRYNGTVSASLEDTGQGIRPEVADRLFEPFFTTKPTGTGLGLYLARSILESHGGTIEFEPCRTGGSRFTLSLPLPGVVGNGPGRVADAGRAP